MQSMVYGIGAVIAGFLVPLMAYKWGNLRSISLSVFIYTFAITAVIWTKTIPVYFLFTIMLAFGNAGARVARNAFIMDVIPNGIMGRVDSLFRVVGLGMRLILLVVFTQLSSHNHISGSFYFLSALLIISFATVMYSSRFFKEKKLPISKLKTRTS
jgi:MFS family permease